MPSRLIDYPNSARHKQEKLIRAVKSVISQTFDDWELHVIADGCQQTIDTLQTNIKDTRIHLWKIEHKKLWSGEPRNEGIRQSKGEWIIYLDIDDVYGEDHLKMIDSNLGNRDWVWFNDYRYRLRLDYWYENHCDIQRMGKHGTSNICHKRSLGLLWDVNGKYSHDFVFTRQLLMIREGAKISTPEYFVCHVPGSVNSGGYDV